MSTLRALLVAGAALAGAPPAVAQSPCFAIAAPGARLECHDRAARGSRRPGSGGAPDPPADALRPLHALQPVRRGPPKGGAHHIAPSGHRRYLPRG